MKQFKKIIIHEHKLLRQRVTEMRERHFESQEQLRSRLDLVEDSFLRIKDELRRTEGKIFGEAKSSNPGNQSDSKVVTKILQLRAEILKSDSQERAG